MQLKKMKEDIENEFNAERERLMMDKLKFAEQNNQIKSDLIDTVKFVFCLWCFTVF